MSTAFNWIYLGTSSDQMDPTEGNQTTENTAKPVKDQLRVEK